MGYGRRERAPFWVEKWLKQQFGALASREGTSKTALLNEERRSGEKAASLTSCARLCYATKG